MATTLLVLAIALVALWNSNQTLLAVVRAERSTRPAVSSRSHASNATARVAVPVSKAVAPGITTSASAPAAQAKAAAATPPADPVVISDNRSWTFAAGYLEGAEEGLLRFGGGIGLAYVDGTWLTGERAAVAFAPGDQEATTITIPEKATMHIGTDTLNIDGGCVIQSTNGQVTSISADRITINRPLTNAAPAAATP
jgi:hypothetical protein